MVYNLEFILGGGGVTLLGNLQFRIWRGTLPDDLQS